MYAYNCRVRFKEIQLCYYLAYGVNNVYSHPVLWKVPHSTFIPNVIREHVESSDSQSL